jgi:hypothetical protein
MSVNRRRPWRQSIDGPFAPRRIEMLESPAYRVLSLSARRVLDRIEIELARHAGNDNGKLPVTYDDFVAYGIERRAVPLAIRECSALGLLEVTHQGRGGNAEFRSPNKFRLLYRHVDRATPTDEWKRIQTIEEAEAIAQAARVSRKTKSQGGTIISVPAVICRCSPPTPSSTAGRVGPVSGVQLPEQSEQRRNAASSSWPRPRSIAVAAEVILGMSLTTARSRPVSDNA